MSFFASFDTTINLDINLKIENSVIKDAFVDGKSFYKFLQKPDIEVFNEIILEEKVKDGALSVPAYDIDVTVSADIVSGRPATSVDPADPNEVVSLQVEYGDHDIAMILPSHIRSALEDEALDEADSWEEYLED